MDPPNTGGITQSANSSAPRSALVCQFFFQIERGWIVLSDNGNLEANLARRGTIGIHTVPDMKQFVGLDA